MSSMNTRNKGRPPRNDTREEVPVRANKDEKRKPPLNDAKRKPPVGTRGDNSRPLQAGVSKGVSVQQKTHVTNSCSWTKGGSSPSFLDVVRGKGEVAACVTDPEPFLTAGDVIAVADDIVDSPPEVQDEGPISVDPSNDEEPACIPMQEHPAVMQVPIQEQEEEIEPAPQVKYYVLEIDRIFEEPVVLPSHVTANAPEHVVLFHFSGQPGEAPTHSGVPAAQSQPQFYRPEAAATRPFPAVAGVPDVSRSAQWNSQSTHHVDLSSMTWRLQENNPRPFHQGMQYNSYAPPMQQPQPRSFISPTVSRMRQHELSEHSLRSLRESGPFNRHPGNNGGVW
uniref:Uncharacterized protein n=1 Tax=Trypanosoma congolense (strain IL3000) TaxID=1068625 RepID=G0UYK8_TRYCI|nr:conserved hypothetical protein [Trypanosoma congolense IL3000]